MNSIQKHEKSIFRQVRDKDIGFKSA